MNTISFPNFLDAPTRSRVVDAALARPMDPSIVAALVAYNQTLPLGEIAKTNLTKLQQGPVAMVVTGQQVGLFGGPLMTIYKALTAVRIAAFLSEESGKIVLPVFWLQCEDHDFAEVARAVTLSRSGEREIFEIAQSNIPGTSTAFEVLTESINDTLNLAKHRFISLPHGERLIQLLSAAYTPGRSLSDAFAHLLAALTYDYGLLFLNPWDKAFTSKKQTLCRLALDRYSEIAALAASTGETTVHVREQSPLFFFHPNGSTGPRYRLERDGDHWKFLGSEGSISNVTLRNMLENHPELFSTSALLRPLFQDSLLPTVCYVGGPAELSYFKQVAPLFKLCSLSPPFVCARAHGVLIEPKADSWLRSLGLNVSDFSAGIDAALKKYGAQTTDTTSVRATREMIENSLNALRQDLVTIDPQLVNALEKTKSKLDQQLGAFEERVNQALAQRDDVARTRIERLSELLFPDGVPQERVLSPLGFIAAYGVSIIDSIYDTIRPLSLADANLEQIRLR